MSSKSSKDIAEAIKALSGYNDLTFEGVVCKVTEVDTIGLTCTCAPLNGNAVFLEVNLNANYQKGFVLVPKSNSIVIVQMVSETRAYVSMVSEVDEILLAGDANGGIVKAVELTAKLNQLITQISANFTAIAATYPYTIVTLTPIVASDFQNNKVKHGNG